MDLSDVKALLLSLVFWTVWLEGNVKVWGVFRMGWLQQGPQTFTQETCFLRCCWCAILYTSDTDNSVVSLISQFKGGLPLKAEAAARGWWIINAHGRRHSLLCCSSDKNCIETSSNPLFPTWWNNSGTVAMKLKRAFARVAQNYRATGASSVLPGC